MRMEIVDLSSYLFPDYSYDVFIFITLKVLGTVQPV